jgi:hypothetical protein
LVVVDPQLHRGQVKQWSRYPELIPSAREIRQDRFSLG